ncbi:MAG: Unknown protein [uncultured Aureispira sp.]|uniref:Glycosyltransferase RgtA/B/C/D-like domain-containing protein n=1 Tax=uncultured Aureispira sp. TaxID=1331704 RepID=A0A6S6UG83_9BACT|nr:MAG: Unknown protein [uncultured Aureispira sp.]
MPTRYPYSFALILVCLCSYFAIHKTIDQARNANPFLHDQAGYYNYLPAFFIYQDIKFSYLDTLKMDKSTFVSTLTNKKGADVQVNRYGIGVAILLSPFFALANLQAYFSGSSMDGFSSPYRSWIFGAQFFYLFLAFFLLRTTLLRYYQDKIVAGTLLLLALGTNLLYYALYEPVMSHNYSFFLFSLCLYWTVEWLEKPQKRPLFLLAIAFGLLANVRLTNSIFIIVLLLWEVGSLKALKIRLSLFQEHWKALGLALVLAISTFLPQMYYWFSVTGYWLVNAYGAKQGTFFWSDPMIFEILLGYKKGWLVYTPLMSVGILGLFALYQHDRKLFSGIFLYTLLNWYVISCWWCWWYGGSFGMRPLIESMVPLSFGIAAFLHWAFQTKWKQFLVGLVVILGIGLNGLQTYQYSYNYIHSFGMTRKAYWTVFGKVPPLAPEVYKEYDQYLLGVYMNEMTEAERAETKTYNERSE